MFKYYIEYLKNLIVLPFKNLLNINTTKIVYQDKIKPIFSVVPRLFSLKKDTFDINIYFELYVS